MVNERKGERKRVVGEVRIRVLRSEMGNNIPPRSVAEMMVNLKDANLYEVAMVLSYIKVLEKQLVKLYEEATLQWERRE